MDLYPPNSNKLNVLPEVKSFKTTNKPEMVETVRCNRNGEPLPRQRDLKARSAQVDKMQIYVILITALPASRACNKLSAQGNKNRGKCKDDP